MNYSSCELCPRRCLADRQTSLGFCRCGVLPKVARAALHLWEEPCISGRMGSGTVFFSGCTLKCCFCQNYAISSEGVGKEITPRRLGDIFLELEEKGAHNINLVTPTHFTTAIRQALLEPPGVPVVWNSGGYERPETLRTLEGLVQIYLPDLKYADSALAGRYSAAPDYFEAAAAAIREMFRQVGPCVFDEAGILRRGVVIRHLLLPGALENTKAVLDWIAETFAPGEVLVSLMSQYTPQSGAEGLLRRRVTGAESRAARAYMENLGLTDGYYQDSASAREEYTPPFDLTGVVRPEPRS